MQSSISLRDVQYDIAREVAMSDEEIIAAARDEWIGVLSHMWDAIGKPVDAKRLEVYCADFMTVPLGLLERSVRRAIRNNTYNIVPTIGALWEAVRAELKSERLEHLSVDEAIEQWNEQQFAKCVIRFGREE